MATWNMIRLLVKDTLPHVDKLILVHSFFVPHWTMNGWTLGVLGVQCTGTTERQKETDQNQLLALETEKTPLSALRCVAWFVKMTKWCICIYMCSMDRSDMKWYDMNWFFLPHGIQCIFFQCVTMCVHLVHIEIFIRWRSGIYDQQDMDMGRRGPGSTSVGLNIILVTNFLLYLLTDGSISREDSLDRDIIKILM